MNDEIEKLAKYYGYTIPQFITEERAFWKPISSNFVRSKKQIAKFIKFLRSCKGSNLKISSTIQKPYERQIKGSKITFELSSEYVLYSLEEFLNTLLNVSMEGLNTELYEVNDKEFYYNTEREVFREEGEFPLYSKPFTNEELDRVIKLETEDEECSKLTKNGRLGEYCASIDRDLKKEITEQCKTKYYSFIYDILVITKEVNYIGKGFSGVIGKEKYQAVRNWINAYLTQSNKKNHI